MASGVLPTGFANSAALNVYHDGSEGIQNHFDDAGRFERPIVSLRLFSDSRLSFGTQLYGCVTASRNGSQLDLSQNNLNSEHCECQVLCNNAWLVLLAATQSKGCKQHCLADSQCAGSSAGMATAPSAWTCRAAVCWSCTLAGTR